MASATVRILLLEDVSTDAYTDDAMLHRGVLQEGVPFLQKPFSLGALARKVRDVIEARP